MNAAPVILSPGTPFEASTRPSAAVAAPASETAGFLGVSTLVLWTGCLAIGLLGFALEYPRPQSQVSQPPPLVAEMIQVQLIDEPLPPVAEPAPSPLVPLPPPPLLEAPSLAEPPPLAPVAEPSPDIVFAVPVEGPVRIVPAREANLAAAVAPVATPAPALPPAQKISYGQGEGRQPAPEYPRQAVREGQEGTVVIRFRVAENGRVLTAEAVSPSPWPLLNEAALRVVRHRWRFGPGSIRLFEVAIRFELAK